MRTEEVSACESMCMSVYIVQYYAVRIFFTNEVLFIPWVKMSLAGNTGNTFALISNQQQILAPTSGTASMLKVCVAVTVTEHSQKQSSRSSALPVFYPWQLGVSVLLPV